VASTILLGLGGWLVISGQLTLGQLVAAELIVSVVIGSFAKMGKHLESFYDLLAAMDKVGHLLDLPIEASGHEDLPETAKGFALALHGVSFAYDGMTEPIISDASLSIRAGGKVAVIGPSGSGKSSLLDLLGGLRAPTAGTVTVEGVDLRILRSQSFRDSTIIVRDLDIVSGNILDNVRLGRNHISVQAVMATLAHVGLDEELERLPEGVRTRLAPNGSPLSRGQALRLLVARAIVQPPRLLIIDGVLDGLEAGVRQRLAALLAGLGDKTTVLIATQSGDIFEYFPQTLPMESLQQGYAAEQSSTRFGDETV
jgi:ABC-type bacteriocin/lantibiotic exporter with double-glycine peptidase domain